VDEGRRELADLFRTQCDAGTADNSVRQLDRIPQGVVLWRGVGG
jgi:hypothetical protein